MDSSPTGTPIIPPKFVPWLALIFSALAGVQMTLAQTIGHPTLGQTILGGALTLGGTLLGVLSPGWRSPPPAGQQPNA